MQIIKAESPRTTNSASFCHKRCSLMMSS